MKLLCLCSLPFWLAAGVPEIDNVDDVVIDAVDQLVKAVDDNAAVGDRTVGIERVDGPDVGAALNKAFGIFNPLHEVLSRLSSELCVDVPGNLAE